MRVLCLFHGEKGEVLANIDANDAEERVFAIAQSCCRTRTCCTLDDTTTRSGHSYAQGTSARRGCMRENPTHIPGHTKIWQAIETHERRSQGWLPHQTQETQQHAPDDRKVIGLVVIQKVAEASHPDIGCDEHSDCVVHLRCRKVMVQQKQHLTSP